jgi:hypothetical protein
MTDVSAMTQVLVAYAYSGISVTSSDGKSTTANEGWLVRESAPGLSTNVEPCASGKRV